MTCAGGRRGQRELPVAGRSKNGPPSGSRKGGKPVDALRATALTLIIIGAVNWGLIALFNFDLVDAIFGGNTQYAPSLASRIVYALVALSGLYALTFYRSGAEEGAKERAS